jgi:hypothetical protein
MPPGQERASTVAPPVALPVAGSGFTVTAFASGSFVVQPMSTARLGGS